jgi:hypothetical protein
MSDIEGKATRVGATERGQRRSFKFVSRKRSRQTDDPNATAREWSRRESSDIDGQTERSNGAFGKSDIEGKAAMGSGERAGKRTSFK